MIHPTGAGFADVALLGTVPALGVRTPALASGDGAERFAELMRPLGMPVEVVGDEPGDAAGLKLLRSVFMKGVAASALESVEGAKARGADEWLRRQIAEVLGEPLLERLLSGSVTHAERRLDEMEAAAAYLEELGVDLRVSRAAAGWLGSSRTRSARATLTRRSAVGQLTVCSVRQPSAYDVRTTSEYGTGLTITLTSFCLCR